MHCVICFQNVDNTGVSPHPVTWYGRACSSCHERVLVPAREFVAQAVRTRTAATHPMHNYAKVHTQAHQIVSKTHTTVSVDDVAFIDNAATDVLAVVFTSLTLQEVMRLAVASRNARAALLEPMVWLTRARALLHPIAWSKLRVVLDRTPPAEVGVHTYTNFLRTPAFVPREPAFEGVFRRVTMCSASNALFVCASDRRTYFMNDTLSTPVQTSIYPDVYIDAVSPRGTYVLTRERHRGFSQELWKRHGNDWLVDPWFRHMGLAEGVEDNLSGVSIDEQGILYVPKQKNNSSWDIVESDRVVDVSHRGVSWADDNFVSPDGQIVVGIQTLYDDVHGYVSIVEVQSRITNKRVTRELYYVIRDVFFVGERHNTIFLASVALDSFATLLTDVLHDSEPKLLPQFTTYARDMPVYYGDDAVSKLTRDRYFYFHNPDDKDRNASVYFMERPDVIV